MATTSRLLSSALLAGVVACAQPEAGLAVLVADPHTVDVARAVPQEDGTLRLEFEVTNTGDAPAKAVAIEVDGAAPAWMPLSWPNPGGDTVLEPGEVWVVGVTLNPELLPTDPSRELAVVITGVTALPAGGCQGAVQIPLELRLPLLVDRPAKCDGDGDGADGWPCGGDDCDDFDALVFPGAEEICNGVDDDCDGEIDDDPTDGIVTWADNDGDGFGLADSEAETCGVPEGRSDNDVDCDDESELVFPGADELCNGADDDCDGLPDLPVPVDAPIWHDDEDDDGYGSTMVAIPACEAPLGFIADGSDCNDADPQTNPAADEVCNGRDDDCDSLIDEEGGGVPAFLDGDGDGYGDPTQPFEICEDAPGFSKNDDDCDDDDDEINPDADEVCDGVDNDCDLLIDDGATDLKNWYPDADLDGYGANTGAVFTCTPPAGSLATTGDCDDSAAAIHPDADELCNGVDDDCDLAVDEEPIDATLWFVDGDGDGHGIGAPTPACEAPPGTVALGDDCDDTRPLRFPGAEEICNNADDDCNFVIDDVIDGPVLSYRDADEDGYGDPDQLSTSVCFPPDGYVLDGTDCDDSNSFVHPDAIELCDLLDNNCDAVIDEGTPGNATYWADADGDGYGDPADSVESCGAPAGYVQDDRDCNDAVAKINPGMTETCDGVDEDCDELIDNGVGTETWYVDVDGDSFGDSASGQLFCQQPEGGVKTGDDCDDSDAMVYPGAPEQCDGRDQDCDALVDEDIVFQPWWVDGDADSYGVLAAPLIACVAPGPDFVNQTGDCKDSDATVYPGAPEICDGIDQDCDLVADDGIAVVAWSDDGDGDGFGAGEVVTACAAPDDGWVDQGGDCADSDPEIYPGADETCDGVDNDCDAAIDEDVVFADWYLDADGDGYGGTDVVNDCVSPGDGYVNIGGDCNDADDSIHPGAVEICDGVDQDCDSAVDEGLGATTWYTDSDLDSFGDDDTAESACGQPAGTVAVGGDCNDADPLIFPGAAEDCDGVDDDCDGVKDDGVGPLWFVDGDSDGFGTATTVQACVQPPKTAKEAGDCDDTRNTVYPGAPEVCDSRDNDCNGQTDEGAIGSTWYRDQDADTYGNAAVTQLACAKPAGYVANDDDCNDADATIKPGAQDICDGKDNDCDGTVDDPVTWYRDNDTDTWGDATVSIFVCAPPVGYVLKSGDCNDYAPSIYPGAPELCDQLDNDCDLVVDENAVDKLTVYNDADGDNYGNDAVTQVACFYALPTGPEWVGIGGDCDDTDPDINPGAQEICDAEDNNCSTTIDEAGVCPCPVETYNGHGYAICEIPLLYTLAEFGCDAFGYNLVKINDADENTFVRTTATTYGAGSPWIGFSDQSVEGTFRWPDGTTGPYTNWATGEPNNGSFGEDCAIMGSTGTWNDVSCFNFQNFICESP